MSPYLWMNPMLRAWHTMEVLHLSETGRARFRRVWFQTPNSVSFGGSLSSGERTQRVPFSLLFMCQSELTEFSQNSPSLLQNSVRLSEFSSPKQYSRNSIPPVSQSSALRARNDQEGYLIYMSIDLGIAFSSSCALFNSGKGSSREWGAIWLWRRREKRFSLASRLRVPKMLRKELTPLFWSETKRLLSG